MTQRRDTQFHAQDTSALQNRQLGGIVRPGVYMGYKLRPNAADRSKLDLTHGPDSTSILVTAGGDRIEELDIIQGFVAIDPPNSSLSRIDVIVAEYQFTTNNSIEQTYRALRGSYPAAGAEPTPAALTTAYQIPLAYVTVRSRALAGSSSKAVIRVDDIIHVAPAVDVRSPIDIAALRPVISTADTRRIFVYPGTFPDITGATRIDFRGGYSAIIDGSDLSEGETRYYLFGVSDDGDVVQMGDAATEDGLPALTDENLVICAARALMQSGSVVMQSLTDYRFLFTRALRPSIEEETYKGTLRTSVFNHLRVDLFRNSNLLALASLSDTDVTAEIDRGISALVLSYTGTGTMPSAAVTIATTNLLADTSISRVQYLMVMVDTAISGLTVDVSASSATAGFTNIGFEPGDIIRVPSGPASRLYLRFNVPATAFIGESPTLFSYGVFMGLDENVLNTATIADVGIDSVKNSISNLIANGNFRFWSRDDGDGNTPDVDARQAITYPVTADDPFVADGWQFTTLAYDGSASRVGLSADVLSVASDTLSDTAFQWQGSGGGQATNVLEYRVPVPPGLGKRITFACNYKSSSIGIVAIGVVLYGMTDEKVLVTQGAVARVSALATTGEMRAVSDITVNESTVAVGFIVYLTQTTGASVISLWNARAAVGDFRVLPYTEPVNAADHLRQYYERGRVVMTTNAGETDVVGASVQFGSKKHTLLGTLEARTIPFSDSNRSLNVAPASYTITPDGLVLEAEVASTGLVRLDVDFEAFIRYGVTQ